MMNYDDALLRSRQIDPTAPYPPLHQALRIALYDEYAAHAFYSAVVAAFGPRPPFTNIVQAEARHIAVLSALAQRFGIPRPLDPFPTQTTVEPSWRENCERAIVGELANIQLYDHLLAQIAEPEARQVFQNLRQASLERHLPAFRQALLDAVAQERYHGASGIAPQQAYVQHGPLSDLIERTLAHFGLHAGPLRIVGPLLRRSHPALLAGLLAGGAGVYVVKSRFARNHSKEN